MFKKCAHEGCFAEGTIKSTLRRRGGRAVYLCPHHAYELESYFAENDAIHGKNKVHGETFGVELETSRSTIRARAELCAAGYIPTSDSTVDVEYKSPIYHGLNALSKTAETIEALMASGDIGINHTCGTHTHYGRQGDLGINEETITYLRRFYNSLFVPLCEAMQRNPIVTAALFGRGFGRWATPITMTSPAMEHTNFVNLQHEHTIEWRICYYRDARQYMRAVHFVQDAGRAICNNFIAHFNDTDIDRTRYAGLTFYRLHKAQVTAQKLVKLFNKYGAEAIND